jgi:hypothetical protein
MRRPRTGRLPFALLPLGALAGSILGRRLTGRRARPASGRAPLQARRQDAPSASVARPDRETASAGAEAGLSPRPLYQMVADGGTVGAPIRAPMPQVAWLLLVGLGALAASVAAGWLLTNPVSLRIAIAASIGALVLGIGLLAPRKLLLGLVVWLAALGLVRRLVSELGPSAQADPLLLVGPLAMAVLVVAAAEKGAFGRRSRLANAVAVLSILTVAGAFNPAQGSLLAGAAGLLFVLVPMLGFWIGRALCDDRTLSRLLAMIAGLGVLVALYGLAQTFRGFLPWDDAWIQRSGYEALQVYTKNGQITIRPFSTFSAASEYAFFGAIALFVWLAFGLRRMWAPFAVVAVAILGTAVFYQSSRGILFTSLAGLVLMAGAWMRLRLGLTLAAAGVASLLLPSAVAHFTSASVEGRTSSPLVTHQVEGLTDPLNPEVSTLGAHISQMKAGLESVTSYPLGRGTGTISLAGDRFGGTTAPTEVDPSNMAVALGIPGLLAYLVVLVAGLSTMYRVAFAHREPLALLALGIVALTVLQWLNGGQYAVAFLPWLLLGWADRRSSDLDHDEIRDFVY